ncbi:sulfurtransferase [Paenibacillus caseinilyticus]|uniref:Sulfurtransferase n=1 Tax=Paenibacillus mucilaginosus K02 TaxID=997761 RepID=I0BM62_9BACL|nr:sulfurtransferase [Paenibacillus mucilaginosus]AFH63459.1 sulfurtransferase [Paenibacillus mucilaginosus K02]WFA19719.1 sulfurtransferase [Paenibacillus mucilaginosus]
MTQDSRANHGGTGTREAGGERSAGYPNAQLLVEPDWLEEHAASADVVLLDARAQGYGEGHIPGASWLDVKRLKDADGRTFASAEAIREALTASGVRDGRTVVVYDDGGGVTAARVFYVLEAFGWRDKVKVLNGGFAAWKAAGKAVSTDTPSVEAGSIAALTLDERRVTTKERIQAGLEGAVILDTRSREEYTGEDTRTNRKGGHIPGAVHREWKDSLLPPDENGVVRFKPAGQLLQEFEEAGVRRDRVVVPHCQSNQRGAHSYFVLRLLGYEDVRPYEGSWDEWGNAEDTEVEG